MKRIIALGAAMLLWISAAAVAAAETVPAVQPTAEPAAVITEPVQETQQAAVQTTEAVTAEPAVQPATVRTVSIPLFTDNQVMNLPNNITSFWFSIPEGTVLGGDGTVRLHMETSDTLINERSSITLSVNGEQLATMRSLEITQSQNGWWQVSVPADILRLNGSLNELTFASAQRSIEGDCADIDNPSNWVKLVKDSYLLLPVAQDGQITLSNAMTYMFDTLENTGALAVEFIVPANAGSSELSAMLQAASAVGTSYPYRYDLDLAVSQTESADQANKLYVGLNVTGGLPVPALRAGQGALAVGRDNGINRLVVTGADTLGLERAVRVLGTASLLREAQDQTITIGQDIAFATQSRTYREDGYYTLEDFGLSDINLAGAFHQQTGFILQQPGGMKGGALSYIEISFRHSEALVSDNSLLTLYLNGSPVGSAKLSASNAKQGRLKVTLPADALDQDTINVTIEVYNYLGKLDCSKDYSDTAWTVIEKASVVYWEPGDDPISPSLSNFPRLSGDTCVVIADQTSMALAAAAAMRGGQQNGQTLWLAGTTADLNSPRADADYIILSDNRSLSLPVSMEGVLPIVPMDDQNFIINKETGLISAVLEKRMLVQAVRAPWSDTRRIYVITYPTGGEQMALALLSKRSVTEAFADQIVMVQRTGAVSTLDTTQMVTQSAPPLTWERFQYLVKTKTGYPVEVIGVLLAALIVIIILIIRVSVNRSRFKHAAEGVRGQNIQPQIGTGDADSSEDGDVYFEEPHNNNRG